MSKNHTRRLRMESLENRQLMAGMVTALVDSTGGLLLQGDQSANHVLLMPGANPGDIVIYGNRTGSPTTGDTAIRLGNGAPAYSQIVHKVKSITANMGGGVDSLSVGRLGSALNVTGSVVVNLGNGGDRLTMDANIGGLTVNGGNGGDQITIENSTITKSV